MRIFSALLSAAFFLLILGAVGIVMVFDHYSKDLPDYSYLKDYQPPILTRIYADDGRMMATIAQEQRVFIPIKTIPHKVIEAFLSAEDEDFYRHGGVDYSGIARAILINLQNVGRDRRPMGASTITQQVAKNMLLSNEVSLSRKVREMILATRLEKVLAKDRILEIYLNEIFLGNRSYGVAAAALSYFNKSLDELTLAEAAYLAALPKAPNSYNPTRNHDQAVERRNWVLSRMAVNGYISDAEKNLAQQEPLEARHRDEAETVIADYFSEEVRRQLIKQFGEETVLGGGLAVKTSLNPRLQTLATKALRDGLISYDRRERGWRGPVAHIAGNKDVEKQLKAITPPPGGEEWPLAIVIGLRDAEAQIIFLDGKHGIVPWPEMKWARRELDDDKFGPAVRKPSDVLALGDVIMVEHVKAGDDGKPYPENAYTLRQVPVIQGAIVAMDPNTGRVFAVDGGFSARISQFNRATQAQRQPGSAFKPFIYMAALDKGFTPSSLVLDAPFEYFQGPGLPLWHPENYSQEFYGPTPLRVGIEKSRNVMTVRLANAIGMPAVVDYAKKFGIVDDMPELLSFSLGAKETTPLRLTAAYGMIVNGGRKIVPSFIDRVQNREGKTVWRVDERPCEGCSNLGWAQDLLPPDLPDTREQIEDPRTAYQMVSMLQGVVQRGTAAKMHDIPASLAGKTGTTNDSKDAWFVGFTPDLVCGVFVGYDNPKPLGSHETGASVAVPIFRSFITGAIKNMPNIPFRMPPGLRMVKINPATGGLANPTDKSSIWEAYIPGTEPQEGQTRTVLDGSVTGSASDGAPGLQPLQAKPTETVIHDGDVTIYPDFPVTEGADMHGVETQAPGGAVMGPVPRNSPPGQPTTAMPAQSSPATMGTGGLY